MLELDPEPFIFISLNKFLLYQLAVDQTQDQIDSRIYQHMVYLLTAESKFKFN
jgi:hypothetical protein